MSDTSTSPTLGHGPADEHLPDQVERLVEPSRKSRGARAFDTIVRSREARIGFELDTHGAFDAPGHTYSTVVQLLRRLVGDNEVLAPVTAEAEKLLRVSL